MNFRFQTRFIALCLLSAFVVPISATTAADFEIGKWANFCQGAVSHTFDDNTANQTKVAQPLFDAKGLHMTLFTCTGSMSPNWDNCKKAFANGHEIASHSVTHAGTMPDAECPTSQATIKQNVPGEPCITIAYPNCNIPSPTTNLKRCYIAGRVCDGQQGPKTPSDFWRVSCKMAGSAGVNTASGFNSAADQAASSGGWMVWCHHGVGNDGHGYSNTNTDALSANITYLDQKRSTIWTETFGNISRYIYERDSSKITVKSSTDQSIAITVTDKMADSIFNYPLSIRCPLPTGWTTAVVMQKGAVVFDTIVTVSSKQYIMFNAIPDAGDVVISKDPVAMIRSASAFEGTFPVMRKHATLIIDTRQFNGSTLAVTFFDLSGKLLDRYTLGRSDNRIALPADKINQSAFIAKITGGNKTYIGRFMPQ
jgi:hypothetical protein